MSGIPHLAMHHNPDLLKQSEPDYHHSVMGMGKDLFAIKRFDNNGIMPDVVLSKTLSGQHLEKLDALCVHLNSHQFHTRLNAFRTLEANGWMNLASCLLLQKYEQASHSGRPEFKGCPPKIRWTPLMDERLVNKVIINSSEDAKRFLEGDWKVERPEISTECKAKIMEECEKDVHPFAMQCHPGIVTANDIAQALGEHGRHINLEELSEEDKQVLAEHLAHTDNPVELIKKWVMETGSSVAIDSFGRALATMQGTCNDLTEQVGQPVYDPVEADGNVVTSDESCDGNKAFDILKSLCR